MMRERVGRETRNLRAVPMRFELPFTRIRIERNQAGSLPCYGFDLEFGTFAAGQVGLRPDGTPVAEAEDQMMQALDNLGAVLAAHGMGVGNLVKMTVFLTDPSQIPAWRRRRDAFLGGHAPTSTLLIVAGLASGSFLVEVEGEAVA